MGKSALTLEVFEGDTFISSPFRIKCLMLLENGRWSQGIIYRKHMNGKLGYKLLESAMGNGLGIYKDADIPGIKYWINIDDQEDLEC